MFNILKHLRESNKYSQEEVAEKLGITRQSYIKYEKNIQINDLTLIKKLASFYDVDYSCFIENKLIEEYSYNIIDKSESKTSKEELRIDIPMENIEKFKQVFLYILKKVGAKPNVGQTVLYKLLYFIDFDYYELFETQLMGLRYIKNHYGPSPVAFTKLVKEMEDKGIGRPATYTPTITLLASRNYTEKDGKELKPTDLGVSVVDFLEKYFSNVINVKFTAQMETNLDKIAEEGIEWQNVIKDFYTDFAKELVVADKESVKIKVAPKPTDEVCDKCGSPMVIRTGKFGEFLACSNYPTCKNVVSMNKPKEVAKCPKCGKPVLERKSKKGAVYYGCSGYPDCDFISWEIPLEEKCPKCNSYLTYKTVYGNIRKKCSKDGCDYTVTIPKEKKE